MGENKENAKQGGLFLNELSSLINGLGHMAEKVRSSEKGESKSGKDALVDFLKTTPEALEAFENAYRKEIIDGDALSFDGMPNAKQAAADMNKVMPKELDALVKRIVDEFISQTPVYRYDGQNMITTEPKQLPENKMVTKDEVMAVPANVRPECSGNLMKKDLNVGRDENGEYLLSFYMDALSPKKTETQRRQAYHLFRQGLDLQDLDAIMYAIIDRNQDSMGHWLPALVEAVKHQDYFKIPKTTMIKVPLSMLQLTRLDYSSHTPTTLKIVDDYCYRIFELDEKQTYFIRTGTSSLKFDFRNVKVTGAKEVHELGEYLLFNHFRGILMASPMSKPSFYGMQTTVEWAVREYIEPKERVPEIYFGLPLRLELRVFIDATDKRILGIAPYWDPKTMKKRFSMDDDFRNPDKIHDYVVYCANEPKLMEQYEKYKDKVLQKIEALLPFLELEGQWSLDVMFNGINEDGTDDMYLIDMALACNSALVEYVPRELLKPAKEDWIPKLEVPPCKM